MADRIEEIQVLFQKRNARARGPTSSAQQNDNVEELAHDLASINTQWNERLVPLTSTIPNGLVDNSVDAFANGLDGRTLYVVHEATSTSYSSYYNSTKTRPRTIYEQFVNVYETIDETKEDLQAQLAALIPTAAQIAIVDNASLYVATNVEDALAEVMNKVDLLVSTALDLSAVGQNYLPAADNVFDIGSYDKRIKDIHLGPGSMVLHTKSTDTGDGAQNKTFTTTISTVDDDSAGKFQVKEGSTVVLQLSATDGLELPEGGLTLADLDEVDDGLSPSANEVLKWSGTEWVAGAGVGTGKTPGRLTFWDTGESVDDVYGSLFSTYEAPSGWWSNTLVLKRGLSYDSVNFKPEGTGDESVAIGGRLFGWGVPWEGGTDAAGEYSIAIGHLAIAEDDETIAIGYNVYAEGYETTVIGNQAYALGNQGIAIGRFPGTPMIDASSENVIAIGYTSVAYDGDGSVGIGTNVILADGNPEVVAIGNNINVTGSLSIGGLVPYSHTLIGGGTPNPSGGNSYGIEVRNAQGVRAIGNDIRVRGENYLLDFFIYGAIDGALVFGDRNDMYATGGMAYAAGTISQPMQIGPENRQEGNDGKIRHTHQVGRYHVAVAEDFGKIHHAQQFGSDHRVYSEGGRYGFHANAAYILQAGGSNLFELVADSAPDSYEANAGSITQVGWGNEVGAKYGASSIYNIVQIGGEQEVGLGYASSLRTSNFLGHSNNVNIDGYGYFTPPYYGNEYLSSTGSYINSIGSEHQFTAYTGGNWRPAKLENISALGRGHKFMGIDGQVKYATTIGNKNRFYAGHYMDGPYGIIVGVDAIGYGNITAATGQGEIKSSSIMGYNNAIYAKNGGNIDKSFILGRDNFLEADNGNLHNFIVIGYENHLEAGAGTSSYGIIIGKCWWEANKDQIVAMGSGYLDGEKDYTILDDKSIQIGYGGPVAGEYGCAIGYTAVAYEESVAVGPHTYAADEAVAIGTSSQAEGNSAIAIGRSSEAYDYGALAVGEDAHASSSYAIAIGEGTRASGGGSIAIGKGADTDSYGYSIALGYNAIATSANQVMIGSAGANLDVEIYGGNLLVPAGQVGIGTSSPAASAALEISSTTGALLVSRMSTTERNALTAVDGMVIYNTTVSGFQGRAGGSWVDLH